MLVNKIDLVPYLDVDLERLLANIDAVHPGVPTLLVSARAGDGIESWCEWLLGAVSERSRTTVACTADAVRSPMP